jgi:hypothetical protein
MQGARGGRLGSEAERWRVGAARAAVDEQRKRQSGARERQQACVGDARRSARAALARVRQQTCAAAAQERLAGGA